ncbi:hypothetical protein ACP70R_044542 [Stipagrostis hirtigluma subsp. patula]
MAGAEPPPPMEEPMPTTQDTAVDGEGYKDVEALEGEALDAVVDKAEEGAEPCGDDLVAAELVGIAQDPNPADVTTGGEPEEGVGVEVQRYEVAAAVNGLTEVDAAPTSSALAGDLTAVVVQTEKVTAVVDDLTEVGIALVDGDSNAFPTEGAHRSDGQAGQDVGGGSLDEVDEAARLLNYEQDDITRMNQNVVVTDDVEHAQDEEGSQMDALTMTGHMDEEGKIAGENVVDEAGDSVVAIDVPEEKAAQTVEVLISKTEPDRAAEEGPHVNTLVQAGDDSVAEDVATIAAAPADDEGIHTGVVTTTRDDNKEKDVRVAGVDATDDGIQMDKVGLTGDGSQQKEFEVADDDHVEEEGMQMDAVTMTGHMVEEGRITGENVADEVVDGAVGIDAPQEQAAQMDEAGGDVPEDEAAQIDGIDLTSNGDEQKVAATADDDGAEEDAMQMDAAAMTNDEDEDGIGGEDAAEEAVDGMTGDDVPEEEAAHMDDEDDDDEEPPPLTRKGGGRRKRGRPSSKAQAVVKPSIKKKDEEEVCFICFDGGNLVICDRRGCPKAYHPSCVNRDDDFFKSKGRWNCGWHICSNCQKPARNMCFTCTYSLCKACIKEAKFICVRGNKGFCETCMNTVMMIENKEEATDQMDVDFDDKSSWWYLFKDYWLSLKKNLSLTVEEISTAKCQMSGSSLAIRENELPDTNDEEANSESSSGQHLGNSSSKKRGRKQLKQAATEDGSEGKEGRRKYTKRGLSGTRDAKTSTGKKVRKLSKRAQSKESESVGTSTSSAEEGSWASKELLNFVAHMRNGDTSVLTQFDVQALLLQYIKRNNLRDPRRKSQIVCDSLLQSLFAKERVGHFEMLKLLESHFLMSEVSPINADENHGGVVDPDPSQDADGNSEASVVMSSEKRKKSRKYDQRGRQPNLDDYAAIDNHNIGLMYLRRNLMEELMGDVDTFDEKVVGSFVRIRIPGTGQRQDIYRLVQIVGTGRAAEKYKSGKKTTDITLEILNLDKREVVTIDIISNQEFTEEECKRLRQSIKYGFIPRLTVGEVQEKARVLQALKVNDWIEKWECVEKLKLLSTPEERARRLNEEPEIHADPAMDPDYESPEEHEQEIERSSFNKSRGSFIRKDGNLVSPGKGDSRNAAQRDQKTNWESNRNTWAESSSHIDSPLARRSAFSSQGDSASYTNKSEISNIGAQTVKLEATTRSAPQGPSGVPSETSGSGAKPVSQSTINESEKIWQYMDPSGKIQGPFSIVQLRKWNSSGYFPPSLKIWKASEKQDDSILLTDALMGKFEKDLPPWEPPHVGSSQIDNTYLRSNSDVGARPRNDPLLEESTIAGEQTPKPVVLTRSFSSRDQRNDYSTTNLGSSMTQGYYGMQNSQAAYTSQQSLTGTWNAPSSQFGVAVNPMTPTQPAMGGLSGGQNFVVAGNIGHLTHVIHSDSPSQSEPQRVDTVAGGSESKLRDDASHARMSSSDLGQLGAHPGTAQQNTQQPEAPAGTRNQLSSTDANNSMVPSQLMSTPSTEPVQPSATTGDSQNSGWAIPAQAASTSGQAQVAGNVTWPAAAQGDASMGWGMMGQSNMNMPWTPQVQGAATYNMGLTIPGQPNVVPNMGWVPNQGNTNMNMIWAATQGQGTPNAAAMMGAQMQGVAMTPWGGVAAVNANHYPGWGTQGGNMNQNIGWSTPAQGNPGQGNNNMNWNSPNGNNQQRDNGGRHSGHRGAFNTGDSGGRSWQPRSGGDGGRGRNGVCWLFMDNGVCTRENCRFFHPPTNDRHFDRQHSGSERRYENHNERNDRRDRQDDRYNDRDDDRHDDRQTDRSQSREPR